MSKVAEGKMMTSGVFSSTTEEWATPKELFQELNARFHFTLDPCCTHENAKCEKHYTKEDDGLCKPWGGGDCLHESTLWQGYR